ncbi:hypothetical protein ACFV9P_13475 [Streptomyces sp. NPDC059892]|uniref:hypothetical protein n=1 Tax=Streptomyces sp. NPDC059892 TaxID=3346989 RepID=UPI00365606A9
MARNKDDGSHTLLSMLHNSLTDTRRELRAALAEGFDRLRMAGDEAHRATQEAIASGLNELRTELRETKEGLARGREELGQTVETAVEILQDEVQQLKEAVEGLRPGSAGHPSLPFGTADGPLFPPGMTVPGVSGLPEVPGMPGGVPGMSGVPGMPSVPSQREEDDARTVLPGPSEPSAPAEPSPDTLPEPSHDPARPHGDSALSGPSALPRGVPVEGAWPGPPERVAPSLLDALRREFGPLLAHLEEARGELAAVRADITALTSRMDDADGGLRTPGEPARQAPPVTPVTALHPVTPMHSMSPMHRVTPVPEEHGELLKRAARVSSASLVCHRDTWEFITGQAGRHSHFRMPPRITDRGDDRIAAALSGRSLIAILISLFTTRHTTDAGDGDWALATTLYERIGTGLDTLAHAGTTVTITLDDRAHGAGSEDGDSDGDSAAEAGGGEVAERISLPSPASPDGPGLVAQAGPT